MRCSAYCLLGLSLLLGESGCNRPTSPVGGQPATAGSLDDGEFPPDSVTSAESRPDAPPSVFTDVTRASGVDFSFRSGRDADEYAILESLGGGVGCFDYDGDGRLDLMFAGGGSLEDRTVAAQACGLFRNLDNFRFGEVTIAAGATAGRWYNHGIFPADFDNDGFVDVAVSGYGGIQLLRNLGDGTFATELNWSDQPDTSWSTSLAWGDFNGDGNLDLYVPHYVDWSWDNHPRCAAALPAVREVCPPKDFQGLDDRLYLGDGEGRFVPALDSGLAGGGKGLGAIAADLDLDGDTDLYVANDTTDNFLYLNQGNARFEEAGLIAGLSGDDVGVNTGSMGVDVADMNGDGLPDVWVTNFERELFALYRNEGSASFTHISRAAGLAVLGGLYVGFGTVLIDYDYDGDRDLVVANGHVSYHSTHSPYKQQALLLENLGRERFRRADPGGYFAMEHTGRGLAYADLNNDGGWDLIFTHSEEPAALLRGRVPSGDRWAQVRLVGTSSNRDAIGAHLYAVSDDGRQLYMRNGGGSYLSQSDPRILLIAPTHSEIGQVQVAWPSGRMEWFDFPNPQTESVWIEGCGSPPQSENEARGN